MTPTRRNHYNPCFWTAFWNRDYYEKARVGGHGPGDLRNQQVFALNVKADKIITATVQNVHFDKDLGVAEIAPDAVKRFCQKYFPDRYEQFCREMAADPEPVFLDFETILTEIEKTEIYGVLIEVITKEQIETREEKAALAAFILFQNLRSHAVMNSALEFTRQQGNEKFELFWLIKQLLSDPDALCRGCTPLMRGQWTVYRTKEHTFPLSDSPVLVNGESIMTALSPRLLLEVKRNIPGADDAWQTKNGVKTETLAEFRRRTIGNTFREIIFSDGALLEDWRSTREFRNRVTLIRDAPSYNALVASHGMQELWKFNAYGNRS